MVATEGEDGGVDAVDGELTGGGVADDASLADGFAACFELGLDEDDGGSLPGFSGRRGGGEDGGEDEGGGDEGDVHCQEGRRATGEVPGGEEAGVGALAEGDAGVVAEALGDLAVAGVDGKNVGCAVLEHAVGEAAGGCADIEAGAGGEVDVPVL